MNHQHAVSLRSPHDSRSSQAKSPDTRPRRLLILDDDALTGRTLQSIAEPTGFEVRCVTDPGEFFRQVDEWAPQVIILDLIMPQMDGVQVMSALAARRCRAMLIITSGVGTRVLDAAGRSAEEHGLHISGVLAKPFLPAALRAMLARAEHDAAELGCRCGADAETSIEPVAVMPEVAPLTRADLERALACRELFVVFQPKLHCRSGAVAGFEALVRWQHPALGTLGPDQFLPLALECWLMDELTACVFEQALTWFAGLLHPPADAATRLSPQTRNSITLSVNVSAESLANVRLFDELEARCQELDLPLGRIILELTETSAMKDPVASLDLLTRLRLKGFQLSIDDFGTGYSSMLQLARLPFSEIKVDKSFVMTAGASSESRSVMRSIIDLGGSLGLKSTAEGVEDNATLDCLRQLGCDLAQGYHIARPMAGADAMAWARRHDASREHLRLQALRALDVLDTAPEPRFDRLTRLAQQAFHVPMVVVSLVDEDRQWFKSRIGIEAVHTPRDISFCTHAIEGEDTMVVTDTFKDPRFRDNPLVLESPHVRFYAGCPLRVADGSTIGALCLMDTVPRSLDREQCDLLEILARQVETELAEHRSVLNDPRTRVLTRRGFETRARDALAMAGRLGQPTTLVLLDIANLRDVNARFGRDAGDRTLAIVGQALRDTFAPHDVIGRLSGNEFAVLLADAGREEGEAGLARLDATLAPMCRPQALPCPLELSQGLAECDGSGKDLLALLAEADATSMMKTC